MYNVLSDEIQAEMRRINKISREEVIKKEGDIFVAVNVVNQQRRIISLERDLIERISRLSGCQKENKRILKG